MSAFLKYAAPRLSVIQQAIRQEVDTTRAELSGTGAHQRTPDNIAQLAGGLRTFLQFATETGAVTDEYAADLWDRAQRAYQAIVVEQSQEQAEEEPAAQFLRLLFAALRAGAAHVSSPEKTPPEQARIWGYPNGEVPAGPWIGWKDGDFLYIECENGFATAQDLGRRTGAPIPIGLSTLSKRLRQRNMLNAVDESHETNYVRRKFLGTSIRVWEFSLRAPSMCTFTRQTRHFDEIQKTDTSGVGFSASNVGYELQEPDKPDTNGTNHLASVTPPKSLEMSGLSGKSTAPPDPAENGPKKMSGSPKKPDTKTRHFEAEVAF